MANINIHEVYDYLKYREGFSIVHCTEQDEITFRITVTNQCLKSWHDLKRRLTGVSFATIINGFLAESYAILLNENCPIIENRIRTLSCTISKRLSSKRGRANMTWAKKVRSFTIRNDEIQHINELQAELKNVNSEKKSLRGYCETLVGDLKSAQDAKLKAEEELNIQINVNKEMQKNQNRLLQYADQLQEMETMTNKGKPIHQVGERQQHRKLKELKTKIERSVWFARTFGLNLSAVELKDDSGVHHRPMYNNGQEQNASKAYKDLSEDEQDLVKQAVFITDKSCVGEAAYHELTMLQNGSELPRSYLLKQCKNQLNSLVHITKTPGDVEGAQLDFERELINVLRGKVSIYNTVD